MRLFDLKNVILIDDNRNQERHGFSLFFKINTSRGVSFSIEYDNPVIETFYEFFKNIEHKVWVSVQTTKKETLFIVFEDEEDAAQFALLY